MSNLNDVRIKTVTVNIGGKERHLKYTLNAFAELEESYGSIEAAMTALEKGSIKAVRKILWAGLIHEDENLTEREVGNAIELAQLTDLAKSLSDAMSNALPDTQPAPNTVAQK